MFGQAIEREQRRMQSFERFMPEPVDPMLRGAELPTWKRASRACGRASASPALPSCPLLNACAAAPAKIDRIPARTTAPLPPVNPPPALAKLPNVRDLVYQITNFIDGKRSISDIRDAVTAEFGSVPLPAVVDHFERLARAGAITLR